MFLVLSKVSCVILRKTYIGSNTTRRGKEMVNTKVRELVTQSQERGWGKVRWRDANGPATSRV